jgi:murein DD-endopeptidase MepM/ murein hydrolase activator NlpD
MLGSEDDNRPANYAGWAREIIAPGAGTIVVARNDHADQPVAGASDPAYFLPEYKNGGDPGNLVVIDHGNNEFSMIGHMKLGSVRVKVGDKVAQGQVIGLMGNSGDTSGPHVHYQLQNGPDWERSDALPFKFSNVEQLSPGSYFNAK